MRCTIVRYSSLLWKFPITGSSRRTTAPGGDVPPYGKWGPSPFRSLAETPHRPLRHARVDFYRLRCSITPGSGAHGAPCLRSRATFPRTKERDAYLPERDHVPTGESPTYLLERAPRTYWREPHVPTGESPTYLPERAHVPTGESPRTYRREPTYLPERSPRTYRESPRTYRREPAYLLERARVPTGEKPASNLLFWKGLETRRLYRRLEEDTDNRVCRMTAEHSGGHPL